MALYVAPLSSDPSRPKRCRSVTIIIISHDDVFGISACMLLLPNGRGVDYCFMHYFVIANGCA